MLRIFAALLLVVAYAVFWWSLVAFIATRRLSAGQSLVALLATCVLLVLVGPASVGVFARHAHPPPSRFELIAKARAAEISATQRSRMLIGQYAHDHPELDTRAQATMPAWARTVFLAARETDRAVAPLMARFDQSLEAQRNEIRRWQYASPALALQRGLMSVAGTDEARFLAFRTQARAFAAKHREDTGRMLLTATRLDADRLAALPAFGFVEPALRIAVLPLVTPLLALCAASFALFFLAFLRARELEPT